MQKITGLNLFGIKGENQFDELCEFLSTSDDKKITKCIKKIIDDPIAKKINSPMMKGVIRHKIDDEKTEIQFTYALINRVNLKPIYKVKGVYRENEEMVLFLPDTPEEFETLFSVSL